MKIAKKTKTIFIITLFILAGIAIFSIAGRSGADNKKVMLYYLNSDKSAFLEYEESVNAKDDNELYSKVVNALLKGVPNKKYSAISSKEVKVLGVDEKNGRLTIDFSSDFADEGVLAGYAVVKTFCGFPKIRSVMVTANGKDVLGKGFISGDEINLESDDDYATTVVLYFADSKKEKLVKEYRKISVTDTRPAEMYIIAELAKGPRQTENSRLFAENTGVISVEITDGTCYVNFEKGFEQYTALDEKTQKLLIYSLVNSLTERDGVESVQILIDGKKTDKFGHIDISGLLYRNENFIG